MIGSEGRRHRQHRQFAEEDHAIGHRSLQHFYEDDISLFVNYDDISSLNIQYIYVTGTTGLRRKAEGGVGG